MYEICVYYVTVRGTCVRLTKNMSVGKYVS